MHIAMRSSNLFVNLFNKMCSVNADIDVAVGVAVAVAAGVAVAINN